MKVPKTYTFQIHYMMLVHNVQETYSGNGLLFLDAGQVLTNTICNHMEQLTCVHSAGNRYLVN